MSEADERNLVSTLSDYLLLSGCAPVSAASLSQQGVTCAVNCIRGVKHELGAAVDYLHVPLDDDEDEDLLQHVDAVVERIERHRLRDGRTLVYCGLGISRSAAFCLAYLMLKQGMTLLAAYQNVQQRRSIICPNVGFFRQLLQLEHRLYGECSVKIIEPAPGIQVPDVIWNEVYEQVTKRMAPAAK